jgi:hypothetical protein
MSAQGLHQRQRQSCHGTDPVRHGGAVEIDTLASVDFALTVQRQGVAVLRDHHMSQQTGARSATFDRERRQRRLQDRLALPAAHLGPHVLYDFER